MRTGGYVNNPDPADPAIDATMARLLGEYGEFLDDAQQHDVRRRMEGLHRAIDTMRRVPLANGEAPTWPVPWVGRGGR